MRTINLYIVKTPKNIAQAYARVGREVSNPIDVAVFEDGSLREKSFMIAYELKDETARNEVERISLKSEHTETYFTWGIERLFPVNHRSCGYNDLVLECMARERLSPFLEDTETQIAEIFRQFLPLRNPDVE